MKKLPKVFKKKWLKALRSGEYKQGKGLLYSSKDDSYCCLGVACKVQGISPDQWGFMDGKNKYKGIPDILIGYDNNDLTNVLACMNDAFTTRRANTIKPSFTYKKRRSFKQIANWIEKNL